MSEIASALSGSINFVGRSSLVLLLASRIDGDARVSVKADRSRVERRYPEIISRREGYCEIYYKILLTQERLLSEL